MQKKRKLFITLGIIIFLVPLLGIPAGWKFFFTVILGLWVMLSAFFSERTFNDIVDKLIGVRIEKMKTRLHKNKDAFSLKVKEKKEEESSEQIEVGNNLGIE